MKISYNWLKSYISHNLTAEELGRLLTDSGLEVESIEPYEMVKGGFKNIVVGEVLTKEKHPDADRLNVTTVNVGTGEPLQIVCGAANVEAGQKVIVALAGAICSGGNGEYFEIKKSKIRGQASEGMICAEDELGIGSSHEGIMILPASILVGTPASVYFKAEADKVLEIGLTPNRVDAASHIGVARDVKAVLNTTSKELSPLEINYPEVSDLKGTYPSPIEVIVEDEEACPRYSGIYIKDITVADSPSWLLEKLKAIGVKPVNNIVDITNFVLHEIGQPLHAFDADKIKGNKVVVKKGYDKNFKTLDAVERKIDSQDLLICNTEEPMCIAGVFGGMESGISKTTKNVFIESAYFDSVSIRKTSKRQALKTEASFRYERGTDPEITVYALKRAASLILETAGGSASIITDVYPNEIIPRRVDFTYESFYSLTGIEIEKDQVKEILESLDMEIIHETDEDLTLDIPLYRVDVTRPADVVEEILRIYGYNNIPEPSFLRSSLSFQKKPDKEKLKNVIADLLVNKGFYEVMNNSLSSKALNEKLNKENSNELVEILNPLSSDLDVMRSSMLPGLLETIKYNRNRKLNDLKIFEFGNTYKKEADQYKEQSNLAIAITGNVHAHSWNQAKAAGDIYFIKGIAESILNRLGAKYELKKAAHDQLDNYLEVFVNNKPAGYIGMIRKSVLKSFDLNADIYFMNLNWDQLISKAGKQVQYAELSKFPAVNRDLAMVLDKTVEYASLEQIAFNAEKKFLKEVSLFDVYEGDKIESGKKSYALSFTLQDSTATLTDKQIEAAMDKIMKAFETNAGAVIRKG